ncbi:unnamed protein product [Acanthoscelides obtectus]|uniref:Uncharacterized protein n=1 Tax=Acanthoscelides obtectus TaxID=200917 RepID=A0A9P0JVU1_ACAOB|nr:unnamed protein product [Acanthoscelides obtectus]
MSRVSNAVQPQRWSERLRRVFCCVTGATRVVGCYFFFALNCCVLKMAVPFNMPEDHNEVEVIINQLQSLLVRLQDAVRRSRTAQTQSASRVRPAGARARTPRVEEAPISPMSTTLPELLNNLAWLAAISQESSTTTTAGTQARPARRRSSSESSCCDETKISLTAIVGQGPMQDWGLVKVNLPKQTDNETPISIEEVDGLTPSVPGRKSFSVDGILSKFVPNNPVSAPLWTAMICFVGWHLFRAR